jgi:hypothetical protein
MAKRYVKRSNERLLQMLIEKQAEIVGFRGQKWWRRRESNLLLNDDGQ